MHALSEDKTYKTNDGLKVFYNIHRSEHRNKPHLIFIHGLGGDSQAWEHERTYFHKKGYSTLALDLRGHGLSEHKDNKQSYSLKKLSSDIANIIKAENIKKPILVGHCFGGMVSMVFAARYPKYAKKLVLIDTSYKPPFISSLKTSTTFLYSIIEKLANNVPHWHAHTHRDQSKFIGTTDFSVRRILSDIAHTSLPTYLLFTTQVTEMELSKLLDKISSQTLIISGSDDRIFPKEIAKTLSDRITHSELKIIPDANHLIIINNPVSVEHAIEKFIA